MLLGDGVNHVGAEQPTGLAQDVVTMLAMGLGVNQLRDEDGDAWASPGLGSNPVWDEDEDAWGGPGLGSNQAGC